MIVEEEQVQDQEQEESHSIMDDELFMERFRREVELIAPNLDMPEKVIDISVCGCLQKNHWGYRIIQTQEKGKILPEPVLLGIKRNSFDANVIAEESIAITGGYAILDQIFTCGHSREEFSRYWFNTTPGGQR